MPDPGVSELGVSSASKTESMDAKRKRDTALTYLVRLEETRSWLEDHLHVEVPPSTELEQYFRNGVLLAQLANYFAPESFPIRRIYDLNLKYFEKKGIHFKYTDNIVGFFNAMTSIGFPKIFFPETTDIYDMKNMPKLVYCLHALGMYLSKIGKASPLKDLTGKVEFTEQEIDTMATTLDAYGVQMPKFNKIGGILAKELLEDDAAFHSAIFLINEALDQEDNSVVLERLTNPTATLRYVDESSLLGYIEELRDLKSKKIEKFGDANSEDVYDKILTKDEIQKVIDEINIARCLLKLTKICREENSAEFFDVLSAREFSIPGIIIENRDLYEDQFYKFVDSKPEDYILTLDNTRELVKVANVEAKDRKIILELIQEINDSMFTFTPEELSECFKRSKILTETASEKNMGIYLDRLRKAKLDKQSETGDEEAYLWFNEVTQLITDVNERIDKVVKECMLLQQVCEMTKNLENKEEIEKFYNLLSLIGLKGLPDEYDGKYAEAIKEATSKQDFENWTGWFEHKLGESSDVYYYNYKTEEFKWNENPDYDPKKGYLNKEAIQAIINKVNTEVDHEKFLQAHSPSICLIQSYLRTHKLYLEFIERPKIRLLGTYFMALAVRRKHAIRMTNFEQCSNDVSMLQRYFRTILTIAPYRKRINYFMEHVDKIIALQSIIRAGQAHIDYNNIIHTDTPTLKSVSKFVRLLEFDANDLREEVEINNLKRAVLENIRKVNSQEAEIKEFDVKIGLLVRNRLSVHDVVSSKKNRNKTKFFVPSNSKEKNELCEKYGKFFYVLQMNPEYCSKLILSFIGKRNDIFITQTCYALFNYGANIRDEYIITKMFAKSVEMEVLTKIDDIQEFTRGDPLVIKMVITFYRNSKAQVWLTELFSSLIKEILNNKYNINTNPLEIYKQWINQIETETGKTSQYPYDIDADKAMEYPEVVNRLKENIKNMKTICTKFVTAITSSEARLPYGIRYIASTLYRVLSEKFPKESETNRLKIIGNFLYYRLINPVIVSPDLFNIATTAEITPDKRKNLAAISALLQKAAYRKFAKQDKTEDKDLSTTNFLKLSWKKFSDWFKACIDVEAVENHFNIDEYTDQSAIKRPELALTVGQIIETHRLAVEYINELSPTKSCALYKVVESLGDVPDETKLVDLAGSAGPLVIEDGDRDQIKDVMIRLQLAAPIVEETGASRGIKLQAEAIKLVSELIQFKNTDEVNSLLNAKFTKEEEANFMEMQKKRIKLEKNMIDGLQGGEEILASLNRNTTITTLEEVRNKLVHTLAEMEVLGMVSKSDNYQALVVAIAKEIKNRRQYRKNRRFDLLRLRGAIENLDAKDKYLKNQLEYYTQYIKVCTENLAAKPKKTKKNAHKKIVVKYSAAQLHQRGVVLEIEGLSESQFKNVSFEMSSTEDPGVFSVSAKLFGVGMESVELVFQDLLQLQYENVTVMKMFDRAKINVNLLIFTLNKKFFNKK